MTRSLCALLGLLFSAPAAAAEEPALFPIWTPQKNVGYIDATGRVVIPPRFDGSAGNQFDFHEGLAPASEPGGHRGYIDSAGRFAIAPAFSDAHEFSEGLAFVHVLTPRGESDGTAFIDRTGRHVIAWKYTGSEAPDVRYARRFSEGLAAVGWTREFKDTDSVFKQETNWGFVDKTGTLVIPAQFSHAGEFSEGLASVSFGQMWKNEKVTCGYVDRAGKLLFQGPYTSCAPFKQGLAPVSSWIDGVERHGYVDKTGKLVLPLKYAAATQFSEGLACVQEGVKAGFIDAKGAYVIKPVYAWCDSFSEGLARVATTESAGFVDKTGKLVISGRFGPMTGFRSGLASVIDEKTAAYIDRTGKRVWSGPRPD